MAFQIYATSTTEAAVCIINGFKSYFPFVDISFTSSSSFQCSLFLIHTAHECDFADNKILCSCRKGYKVDDDDEKNCVDVDECRENNGGYVEFLMKLSCARGAFCLRVRVATKLNKLFTSK